MKIRIHRKDFYKGIRTVKKAVSSETKLPILSGILLKTVNNKLKLIGTNLELGIEYSIKADIKTPGKIVIPADYIAKILKELPNEKLELTTDPETNTCQLQGNTAKFNIYGSTADEFPLLPELDSKHNFSLQQKDLKEIITQVKFAAAKNTNRPSLTGSLFTIQEDSIKAISTDTYRLAYSRRKQNTKLNRKFILPKKTLTELKKLLNFSEEKVKIIVTENQVSFNFSGILVISRLIEGTFPSCQQVIPDQIKSKVSIDKSKFEQAVKRASFLGSDTVRIKFKKNKAIITANNPEVGTAKEKLPINLTGSKIKTAFNSAYILECLKVINEEKIIIELTDKFSPGIIKTDSEDEFIYVIMPVRSN